MAQQNVNNTQEKVGSGETLLNIQYECCHGGWGEVVEMELVFVLFQFASVCTFSG